MVLKQTLILLLLAAAALPAVAAGGEIEWDPATLVLIAPGGTYGRIVRLKNGRLLAGYSRRGVVEVRPSADDGRTWGGPVKVAGFPAGAATNAELLPLADGRVMAMWNERDRADPRRNGIAVAFSRDGGKTWTGRRRLFTGKCWEPAAVEGPTPVAPARPRIDLYFANEQPYPATNEQEISVLRSTDGGRTWVGPTAATFRRGHRDGMPVPARLADGSVWLAIEDDGLAPRFRPAVIDLTPPKGQATLPTPLPVAGDDPRRRPALPAPLPPAAYAGAPYLAALPAGGAALSFQLADTGDERAVRMAVALGTPAAGFGPLTFPFGTTATAQSWNSLFVKNARTLTAVTGTTLRGRPGLWAIDGHLPPSPAAAP